VLPATASESAAPTSVSALTDALSEPTRTAFGAGLAVAIACPVKDLQTSAHPVQQQAPSTSFTITNATMDAPQAWVALLASVLTANSLARSAQLAPKFALPAPRLKVFPSSTAHPASASAQLATKSTRGSRNVKVVQPVVYDATQMTIAFAYNAKMACSYT
jgi:hypothetical protein